MWIDAVVLNILIPWFLLCKIEAATSSRRLPVTEEVTKKTKMINRDTKVIIIIETSLEEVKGEPKKARAAQ